ncbi:MAG: hypothetical protein RMK18_01895 [Armatimonadota bacterium]|nr:hypothetical protein [Armatimonadota bacterium]MCX7776813.1 hypothetical protein [Armatimonadota bacterium]MDW8024608.1 hypothetical protein [Armatimonadota bacterium]
MSLTRSMMAMVTMFVWTSVFTGLAFSDKMSESFVEEPFVQRRISGSSMQHFGRQSKLATFQDNLEPRWNGTKLLPGSLVQGTHISAGLGNNTTISMTLLNSAEIRPAPTQQTLIGSKLDTTSLSLRRQWGHGIQLIPATITGDNSLAFPMTLQQRGSLLRFRIEHRSKQFNLQFERAKADKDLLTASGAWVNALNSVAPLLRTIDALKGHEFTLLSLDSKLGAFNLSGNWRSMSGSGEVERQSIWVRGNGIKLHIGETRIERGSAIGAQTAAEEVAALASEFESLGKEFTVLGTPMKVATLQPFSSMRQSERLFVWEPSKDARVHHEGLRISNGSGELSQTVTVLSLAGGKLMAMRRTDRVDASFNQQSLKPFGKEALASLTGRKQTVTQFSWTPSRALRLTHTVTELEALHGANTNTKSCKTSMTELSLKPDRHTDISFAFGETETESANGNTSQVKLTQWSLSRRADLDGHNLTLAHSGQKIEPENGTTHLLTRTALSLTTNPKLQTKLQLSVVHTDEHPDRGNDGTHAKMSLQSCFSSDASLAASWERKPTPNGTFESSECALKLAQLKLCYRTAEEPSPQGLERRIDQLQVQHPISERLDVIVNLSSVEQGDEKLKESSLAVMSKNPNANETVIKVSSVNKDTADTSEQTESLTLVQPVTKEMHIGTEIARTSDEHGNEGEQQRVYIAAVPKSGALPQVHVGYERVRHPSGKTTYTPLARVSVCGQRNLRFVIGYALNQAQQVGRFPMRELVVQLLIGRAKLELYRFSNMPQNWMARWTKENWFSRGLMSPFPTLPSGQKLNQLSLMDWATVTLSMPIASDWMLEIGAERLRPYHNANSPERKDLFASLQGKTGRNGKLQFSIRHASEKRSGSELEGLIYTLSYTWKLSEQRRLSLSGHYNTNERIQRSGIQQGAYSFMLSLSQIW